MAAHDDVEMIIDTNEMTYTEQNGQRSTIVDGSSIIWDLIAGAGGAEGYRVRRFTSLALSNGRSLGLDTANSFFQVSGDAAATLNAGELWFIEDNGAIARWKFRSVTIDDVDIPNQMTAVMERVDNTQITMSFTTFFAAD